ncbi:MarC family protein [Klebsiella aerogenes]|uniref:MarC family protein n=1 Tax=Klebsiella aerogenes TaxID=548 RepID=UPI00063CC6ED|nr:MarC family protein [Klebsiella aerogenes]ELI7202345.1 MarC family protein [Klebsiella aerogenes]KLF02076.1 membrane protein [Klebsiella aerogenes]
MTDIFFSFFSISIKLFAIMTPPAILSAFISGTAHYDAAKKRRTAFKTSSAIFIIGLTLLIIGDSLFSVFGFTLDAFRIGSGVLLFLTALTLMNDNGDSPEVSTDKDISVVPLAIPLCMGPAAIGTIIVMGSTANSVWDKVLSGLAFFFAVLVIYLMLLMSKSIAAILGKTGIAILAKFTGLFLAAIAAQVIFTGIKSFI